MHLAAHLMLRTSCSFLADGPIKDACLSFGVSEWMQRFL